MGESCPVRWYGQVFLPVDEFSRVVPPFNCEFSIQFVCVPTSSIAGTSLAAEILSPLDRWHSMTYFCLVANSFWSLKISADNII